MPSVKRRSHGEDPVTARSAPASTVAAPAAAGPASANAAAAATNAATGRRFPRGEDRPVTRAESRLAAAEASANRVISLGAVER